MSLNTNPIKSYTLISKDTSPETACASCPNALWHHTVTGDLRVFCRLMFTLVDQLLEVCDGNPPQPPEPEETEAPVVATDETGEPVEASGEPQTSLADLDLEDLPDLGAPPERLSEGPTLEDIEVDWSDLDESGVS